MRSREWLAAFLVLGLNMVAWAQEPNLNKRHFEISNETNNLVVENQNISVLTEQTIQANRRRPDLTFGFFAGQLSFKGQTVKMGDSVTRYASENVMALGIDVKKDFNQHWGLGFQVEYENVRNSEGSLHIVPGTGYVFGRTRGYTQAQIRGVAELGYSAGYIRQIGTLDRSGGLGATAAFWQGGVEFPIQRGREKWSLGLYYSEKFAPDGDFDLAGETLKLQGAITL